jgi:hypothetical protein
MKMHSRQRVGAVLTCFAFWAAGAVLGEAGSNSLFEYWKQSDGIVISKGDPSISGALTLPEEIDGLPVVKVDDQAFYQFQGITQLTIPQTLDVIDYRAFYNCNGLKRIDIPEGVTRIEKEAFWNCHYVTNITLPASLTSIGDFALGNGNRLISFTVHSNNPAYCDVEGVLFNKEQTALIDYPEKWKNSQVYAIPEGTRSINDRAFNAVWFLRSITFPDSVTHIGEFAFVNCGNWTNAVLPEATLAVGFGAFMGCRSLPGITIPAAVEYIGSKAFETCFKLDFINVSPLNSVYASQDGVLFNKELDHLITCPGGLSGDYSVPVGTESLGYRAFYNCPNLTRIILPDGLTTIGDEAFRFNFGNANIAATSLTNVTFSATVETLGSLMWRGCKSLQSIEVDPANPFYKDIDGVLFNKDGTILLAYPPGRAGSYTVPAGVKKIYETAFDDCDALTSITIPEGVSYLARDVFNGCANLKEIHFAGSVSVIGSSVFNACPSLERITVTSSGERFSSRDGILFNADYSKIVKCPEAWSGRYAIPPGTRVVGNSAFKNCVALTSVSLPDSVEVIENSAFSSCDGLLSAIFLGDAPPVFGGGAFNGASGFSVYYLDGAYNFTSPEWMGYSCNLLRRPLLAWEAGGELSWFAQSGIDYSIASSTNLVSSEWKVSTNSLMTGNGTTNYVQPDYVAESEMFRVDVDLP